MLILICVIVVAVLSYIIYSKYNVDKFEITQEECTNPKTQLVGECFIDSEGIWRQHQNKIYSQQGCKMQQEVVECPSYNVKLLEKKCGASDYKKFCQDPVNTINFCNKRNIPLLPINDYQIMINKCITDRIIPLEKFNEFKEYLGNQKIKHEEGNSCSNCKNYSQFCKNLDTCLECNSSKDNLIKGSQCPQWYPESLQFWTEMTRRFPNEFDKNMYKLEAMQKNSGTITNSINTNDYKDFKGCVVTNLVSPNQEYQLYINNNGNLVILKNKKETWSSKGLSQFKNIPGPYRVVFQTNGDLVVYGGVSRPILFSASSTQQWSYADKSGPFTLILSNTGRLSIIDSKNQEVWYST